MTTIFLPPRALRVADNNQSEATRKHDCTQMNDCYFIFQSRSAVRRASVQELITPAQPKPRQSGLFLIVHNFVHFFLFVDSFLRSMTVPAFNGGWSFFNSVRMMLRMTLLKCPVLD
jgi:hypothetical protein